MVLLASEIPFTTDAIRYVAMPRAILGIAPGNNHAKVTASAAIDRNNL
jgi:hypothetical protein